VFYSGSANLIEDVQVMKEGHKWYGGTLDLEITFRVFYGKRLKLQDRARCHPDDLERDDEIIATILERLAEIPEPFNGHIRFDQESPRAGIYQLSATEGLIYDMIWYSSL
jgi:hypothetical protein